MKIENTLTYILLVKSHNVGDKNPDFFIVIHDKNPLEAAMIRQPLFFTTI